ncbi:MAG: IS5/IS1182 family transposase, partial [Magnetococcus sp. WYHC-3]
EAVIGHQKTEGRLDRNFLRGVFGDKANALLVGIGYNLRAVLRKLRLLFAWFLTALAMALGSEASPKNLAAAWQRE